MNKLLFAVSAVFLIVSSTTFADNFGADRHVQKGVKCEACHGANKEVQYPSIDQCKQCHNPKEVAEKTKNVKPQNPHVSPHYGNELDCALCHVQHQATADYCAQCHSFGFKTP